jgi:hypothetical protein
MNMLKPYKQDIIVREAQAKFLFYKYKTVKKTEKSTNDPWSKAQTF